ncbi:MAG: NAD(P)H-hydrate dehydratase [Anaerolineae bacterium]|nr:NAD(P)H-hydrate dehydratase [Anaerolineae bacterium]
MKLVSVEEMRAIEAEADANGVTYEKMMENAGNGLAKVVQALDLNGRDRAVVGLVGAGNNGGDTLVALTALLKAGWQAMAYQVLPRGEKDRLTALFEESGGELIRYAEDKKFQRLDEWLRSASVLLDGILGTGARLVLSPELAKLLAHVAEFSPRPYVVAVDCPSGVDCDSGSAAAECIPANMTVCMAAVKEGLIKLPAFELVGRLEVVDLGLPQNIQRWAAVKRQVVSEEVVRPILPKRRMDAHKGTFGTAMIVAGSTNYTGAALLAAKAAYRIGTGLVRLAIPANLHTALAGHIPEATWLLLPHEMGVISDDAHALILKNLDKVSGLLLGPGWGLEDTTGEFLQKLLAAPVEGVHKGSIGFVPSDTESKATEKISLPPLVIDADGLKLLAQIKNWHGLLPSLSVLTPHPGEMAILTGMDIKDIQRQRIEVAQQFSRQWGHVIVLKGALTVVADPQGRLSVIPVATPALARAGTGDVLAGMVVGLLAQGVLPYEAAVAAAWVHAQAGLRALDWLGHSAAVLAGDLLDSIAEVLSAINRQEV